MPKAPAPTLRPDVRKALRQTFGLTSLRPGQAEVIERVLAGKPTLAIMPTGAGKSLCYQLPAVLLPGVTLVVSPLIALMQDQCDALLSCGVAAVQLNSALDSDTLHAAESAIAEGRARVVLTTPERLADPAFIARVASGAPVSLLVVDEAHCISRWGHDFRPAFLQIAQAGQALGRPPVLALTATAPRDVAADICRQLAIPAGGLVDTGSYRANLDFVVEACTTEAEKLARAVALVRQAEGAGIVYTATVKAAELVRDALAAADVKGVGLYHGRLPAAERHAVLEDFMHDRLRVVVATNAFGLGIDKQDIRYVLHYQIPGSLDAYYQEAGRAGRDGEPAECILLFQRKDRAVQQFFMAGRYPGKEDLAMLWRCLQRPAPEGSGGRWTLPLLAEAGGQPLARLKLCTSLLRARRLVTVAADGSLRPRRAEVTDETLDALLQDDRKKREADRAGLERMVDYAQSGRCRWQLLLDSVGHGPQARPQPCGHCDSCRHIAEASAQQEAEPLPIAA